MKIKKDNILIKSVAIGTVSGIIITLILTLIFAFVISSSSISLKVSGFIATLILVISSFLSGFISSRIRAEKGLITGALTGFTFYLIIVILSLMILRSAVTSSLVIKLAILCFSSSIGGLLGVNRLTKYKKII